MNFCRLNEHRWNRGKSGFWGLRSSAGSRGGSTGVHREQVQPSLKIVQIDRDTLIEQSL